MLISHTPPCICPNCRYEINAATGVDHDHVPEPKDLTVCFGCGSILQFSGCLTLQNIKPSELESMALAEPESYKKLIEAQQVIRQINAEESEKK